ncbi:titin homolog [Rhodamnia argentea]|uniref:Titin homolog n=1 Tax=Rhodamnia argentea TaxID=178133 RepID=A0A8B8QES9_9MYRT|nr:titin homolog [Rhodamnia argentea]
MWNNVSTKTRFNQLRKIKKEKQLARLKRLSTCRVHDNLLPGVPPCEATATENKIAEAVTMESEGEKRGITCELLDPIPTKFSTEEPTKSPGMQDLPAEITELLINAQDPQSSCDFAESTPVDRKDIDRASEGEKFLESSSEAAIVKAEDKNQLQRAGTLETDERTTDEEKHFQQEKSDQDYGTDDVTSAVSRVAKTVEANFNIIEEQRTEEILDKNVDTGCGPKVDRTDNVADMDPTFVSQNVGENILDVESQVSEKLLDLPAEQKAPQSLDICKQTEDEKVEIDKIIQNGARDASIAAVAASSDTPNEDREFTITSDEGDKKPEETSTMVAADMSMKHGHEVDTVELKETTSTESQDITELSAEMKHVMPAGENEEYKSNSTESAAVVEPVAHCSHQIDKEVAGHMDVEEANDLTQETIIQVVQNTLAQDEDGMDRKEKLDSSSAKHVESMQRDYSNSFSTEASEGERNDSGHLTGEVVKNVSGQGITDAKDHIAKEIPPVNAESEGSFLQQSLQGNEQPAINTEVLHEAVSCIKEETHCKSCEGGSTKEVDEDKSVDNSPNDEEIQENSPINPEGDQQRSEAADLEIECEKVTGEWEACKPKETENKDGSEACKSTEFQDAGHPFREGHDPEDVATDVAASGNIHCTGSVADEINQPTSESEIVLETAPTSRAEHDSCCGEKEKATQADEHEEVKAKSCNTADLTDETIRTSPAENFDTTQKENECDIKSSEESEPAGADRSLEDNTSQGNESSKMSLQTSPPMHGEMTKEVEGKEKGTTAVILADNSSITGLDKVIADASMPEKDSEETANKNVGADEFKRSLDEIPEPTEADSPQLGGTIRCHEELSAKGNDEDNVKYEQNEINKIYEQTGIFSTTEGPEDLILLNDDKETGESTGPDLIEEDPIQERTTEATAHREDNVMGCQVNPSTEEAVGYTKNITEETNAARDFEVLAEGISEGRPSKDDREEDTNKEVHTQLVTFTSCKKTDDHQQEEDAKSKFSPAVDEQEIENQKSKSMSEAISLKEEDKDTKVFTEQVEEAHSLDNIANTEKDNMEACHKIQSTSTDECTEKEMQPMERDEYYQSESPCAPPETNSEVIGAAERFEVPPANGSQAARASAIKDGVPANDNESEAKNHAGSTDTASGVDELPTSAKQERRLENTDSNVMEDDLTDSGQEEGEIPATVDAIKESTECEILDKEPKDSKDLGATEKPAVDTLQGSLCSILKTEAGEEEREASAEYEGPDKNEDHLYGTHSTEGVLVPQEDESTKIVSESEEVETAKGSAQKEVSEDLHVAPEVPFAVLNTAEGTYISATNATEETENQIQVDQHNTIPDERSENTHLETKEIEGETYDEDLKHQESFAPETDIKSRTPEEKVSTENDEDNLKEDYVPDKEAFHSEVSTTVGEEMGAADTISTQNLKTMELTEQTETRNMQIEGHSRLGRETFIAGQVEEEVQDQDKEDPIGLVITPMETIKEDTIKEPDSVINSDIAAVEIGQEEVRPQKEQLDERPKMASGICSDMGPPERTETDHSKHGEEVDGTKCYEISINLQPNSSESDSKSAEREITVVENPTITEEEIELPSDKKDETRASDVKESTETENCSSIENTDAEETEKHEEISERLATSATQNGEPAEDGSAPNQTIPRESTLELLTPASVSLLEEKENGPKTADEKITDDSEDEVEMQLNESLQLSSGTVQTDEACFDKKEPNKDGVSKIDSNDSESEKDTPNGQKDGCIHGEEVLKVETQEKESKTANPDSPEVRDTTAEVRVATEEASSIVSSKSENVHEVMSDVQTNESFTRLEDIDLKDMKVEPIIADFEPEQKCENTIEANDTSQNAIADEVVLQGQLKPEETQNGEELETGKGDKKLLLESCKIGEMKDFVPVLEDTQAIDQAEQAQAGNADNEEIQIRKIENDDESISTSKTEDATKDVMKEVVKETAILDDFNGPTTVAVETAEIGIPPKEASSGVFNKNVHEVMSDVQEYGSSIELEHDEMKGTKVEAVTADVRPEEKCEDAIGANDMSQNGITNEGLPDENKRLEETQDGEQHENEEGDIKISEICSIQQKKDYICPIPTEVTEEVDQDEQAQAGNAEKEKVKDSISVSKTEDSRKDFDEIIKKTDTLDELNATTIAAVETAAEISIPREEALGDMFRKGEHMHEVMSDIQTNESSVGPEDAEMNAMKVEAVTADVEPAEKCEDGIEEIDMSQNAITNEGMTDAHMKAPLLESCTISEKKGFGKALAEVTEATDQFELEKAGHADNEEIQTSESMIHDRLKDCVSVSKIEDATKDAEKESITEAGATDESNATTLIAAPETTEIEIPTEESSGFVLSKSENTHEVVLDVQANESSMGSEDAETKRTQVEEVMANVKPEEKREDASEANDMSQNAITSGGVLDCYTKEGGEENETGDGDNVSLLGSCKIKEKKDFGPVVAEDTEATDQVEEAESKNADNEEIQTSKSKTDDKPEDSVLVCKTADATKDVGKKMIQEVDTPDEFNATTIAAAETEIAMQEPQAEETPVGTSTVPPESVTVQNSNADDFERIRMVSELSHDSNSAHDETIDGAEKTSMNEKLGLVENEAEPDGTAHQVTVSKTDQGKTVFSEETIADQTLSAKKLESLVQTPVFASLPGGGEENMEKVENIEGHDKVAGEMELKENLELSFPEERTDTECLERAEPRNPGVTELEISANESTQDTNEDEKEHNTHGEALKAAPEEKEKKTEFADSPLRSVEDKELSGPYENASDVMFKTSKTAQVDMSEVQTVETSEESEGGEIQDVNLEAVAISKPAEQNEDAITAENVEQEMRNEQEKADGSEETNEQETMTDVDSKETHGTTPGNSIINQDKHTGSVSEGEKTHCDEQTNAEKLASTSESYATVALEEDNILNGGGTYIAQTKDALEDFDVTREIKEEAGSYYDKTDTAAMTSLRTETSTLAILQDDKPLEASPDDLEESSPEATEPGLILSSKNIDKENLDETSSTSVCRLSDREKENETTQNPHVSESKINVAGENDSLLFLVEKEGEAATTDENVGEKSLDGEMVQINENITLTDETEVCCKKADSIKHADTEFEIQDNQVTKDTSCEEDKEGSNQVEIVKLELPEEESEGRSEISASADQGNMGTLAKAAADDLEPEKYCNIATEAADTLKDEILQEEVFIGPGEADEHENLMKEHQVEENYNPNETVAVSPGNRAICEEADSNAVSKEHLEASYSTEKTREGSLDIEEMSNSKCDAQIQGVLHQGKTQEEENPGSVAPTEHANKESEKLKDLDNCYDKVDTAPKTSLTSTPSSCMAPEEEKPVDDSGTGFDKELPKEVEIETSLLKEKFETQLEDEHLATEDENVRRENVTAESLKEGGLGRITIASEAALGSKDPGTDVIDAMEETTAEELDVSEIRSHCLELVHEADATSEQNTSAKALEVPPVSALLQEEHKDERKRDIQNVQETDTVLFSSAAEAKEEIWQKENGQFEPPKVHHPRGSETIQDDLTEKDNECCSTQDEGLEPETQNETKCTDFPSDSEKLMDLTSATESHEQGVCDDLVKSVSQVKIQEDFNEPEDTGAKENQVHALARDLRAEEKGEETSKANETSQGENAEEQIVEQLEDIDGCPMNQEITKGSCEEDELHREKYVEGKTHNTFHSKDNELQYQEDESKHSAVDKDNAPEEFDKVHVESGTADKNSIDEAEGKITSEGATESEDQNSKTNFGSGTTDATICNKESSVEKTQKGNDLGLEEAKETDPVPEQIEYASIAMPEMPVSGEACPSMAPDVTITEGNEDRSPTAKESIVEIIQNSEAKNVELGHPSKADLELKPIEYGGERTCSSDEKTSEEDMPKDTSVVSLSDFLDKIPEGNSPTAEPSSKERRPTDEPDAVPPEESKIDAERDEHEEDEHERTESGHDAPVMVERCKDINVKAPHKKSHNILSGVTSKVKHSISKVKKAITGKSSHSKAHSPK